nr:immunoglobulin heavy chain junction region [Macaca mulatta]MOW86643.1 immunoglobulin heavy chain junction region [Macaca mulatta]MOW86663.1 immunoglobulin heavy chain junction region [Macaca mulatta]MOW86675.1 immunoglobulin heavy chain junction region [Macaca mulatta]MOW86677.1 immunoglobulin heavy chain junction region [Macaca mulatta]
CARQDSNYDSW